MRNLVPAIAGELRIRDQGLLEQDVRLHRLLKAILDSPMGPDLVFKGGTCLTKCYLDYVRFSVDLDFTGRNQGNWAQVNTKQVPNATRAARHAWADALGAAAKELGYDFARREIVWGSNSRMGTAQLRYRNLAGEPAVIKIQVNFVEPFLFKPVKRSVRTLISDSDSKALRLLDGPDMEAYREHYSLDCYDAREIAAEKVRAVLTRTAAKGRDMLDLYLLERDFKITPEGLETEIRAKLAFALSLGEKYQRNLDDAHTRFDALAAWDARVLLLKDIDLTDFDKHRRRILKFAARFLPAKPSEP